MEYIRSLIKNDSIILPKLTMQHNPMVKVKKYTIDRNHFDAFLCLFIFSFLIIPSSLIISPLVEEKENGIKVCFAQFTREIFSEKMQIQIVESMIEQNLVNVMNSNFINDSMILFLHFYEKKISRFVVTQYSFKKHMLFYFNRIFSTLHHLDGI